VLGVKFKVKNLTKSLGKMPSASSKTQAVAQQQGAPVDLLQEPLKAALSVADKKLRNLEKRRVCFAKFHQYLLRILKPYRSYLVLL